MTTFESYSFSGEYHSDGDEYSPFSGRTRGEILVSLETGIFEATYQDSDRNSRHWKPELEAEGRVNLEESAIILDKGTVIWYLEADQHEPESLEDLGGLYDGFAISKGPDLDHLSGREEIERTRDQEECFYFDCNLNLD